jgi:hypothetical protein
VYTGNCSQAADVEWLQAGSAGQPTVFLFSDNQMKEESFLEDINNILNTGTLPWHGAAAASSAQQLR